MTMHARAVLAGLLALLALRASAWSTVDYIVVGGGSAGCVIANRLSAQGFEVLLLESGGRTQAAVGGTDFVASQLCTQEPCDPTVQLPQFTRFDVPLLWSTIPYVHGSSYTWAYPELTLARALGGGGILNAMIHMRARPADFEGWKRDWNISGWDWADILRAYRRMEDITPELANSPLHAVGGPLHVTPSSVSDAAYALFEQACTELGIPANSDFNGAVRTGVGRYQFTIRRGVRESTLSGYLVPALTRPNLELRLYSTATKLLIDENKVVYGVTYLRRPGSGKPALVEKAFVRKEVILTAGAINTPKLLMLSGIGPREHLSMLGVPVVADLKGVGNNLHDHLNMNLVWKWKGSSSLESVYTYAQGSMAQYEADQTGPMSTAGITGGAFVRSPFSPDGEADLQVTVTPRNIARNRAGYLSMAVALQKPILRATLRLSSTAWDAAPVVTDWAPADSDVEAMVWGIQLARAIANTKVMSQAGLEEEVPGAAIGPDQLRARIRKGLDPYNHWVGSAAMGTDGDDDAVVNLRLSVRGVRGLRVADASVMPSVTNGNIHATVVAIAELASDKILEDAGSFPAPSVLGSVPVWAAVVAAAAVGALLALGGYVCWAGRRGYQLLQGDADTTE